mmetsp:Transcript_14948/g.27340  ORF Transcript_14948/g.27340 Transcript_14948/m.27340 type:complete len:98 (+) Transcript_14948:188-481(+)
MCRGSREGVYGEGSQVNLGKLDAALNAQISNVTVNDTEPLNEVRELERERLKDLVMLQQKEIATLQAEINLFRKKGGHIYTTVTANRMPDMDGAVSG